MRVVTTENTEHTERDVLTGSVIGCAIEVHKTLGPGLLESAYQKALAHEFCAQSLSFKTEVALPVQYKGIEIDCAYRMDMVIENSLILELKSLSRIEPIHEAQLLTYMKLSQINKGLLINFNVRQLKDGIKRMVL